MPTLRSARALAPLAVASAVLLSACGGSHHTPHVITVTPATRPHLAHAAAFREGPESIFEPKLPLFNDPAATLNLMRQLGVDRVKVFVSWQSLAPNASSRARPQFDATSPTGYPASAWAVYDTIDRDAQARGIKLFFAVGGPAPLWATQPGAPPGSPGAPPPLNGAQWKPSAADFGQFVRAVGTRYSGTYTPSGSSSPLPRISFWSIWNEPNLGSADLAPQAIDNSTVETSPAMYRGLVDAAWSAFQATGHGGDTILIGELAPYGQIGPGGPGNYGYMVPLRFVRALYCVGANDQPLQGQAATLRACPASAAGSKRFAADNPALFRATGFAMHPYPPESGGGLPPNVPAPGSNQFVNMATLGRLENQLDAVTHVYGSSKQFPIYITEYGYFTNPPYVGGSPPAKAAAYLNQAEYIAWLNPRVQSVDQYLLMDPPSGSGSNFVTGLEFANGTPKPSYAAYRMPIYLPVTSAAHGHALEVWGCVRPAHYAQIDTGRTQHVMIQLSSGAGAPFKTVETLPITDVNGYFDVKVRFASSGTVRLAWAYPHGPVIHSRLVQISIG
jgi:hypothetical protein